MSDADSVYAERTLVRAQAEHAPGALVLDFGTEWCGYCRSARPRIDAALAAAPGVRHLRIEDGPGRALGRSYGVKLWPTLVFLRDGIEAARVTRPDTEAQVAAALDAATRPA